MFWVASGTSSRRSGKLNDDLYIHSYMYLIPYLESMITLAMLILRLFNGTIYQATRGTMVDEELCHQDVMLRKGLRMKNKCRNHVKEGHDR